MWVETSAIVVRCNFQSKIWSLQTSDSHGNAFETLSPFLPLFFFFFLFSWDFSVLFDEAVVHDLVKNALTVSPIVYHKR